MQSKPCVSSTGIIDFGSEATVAHDSILVILICSLQRHFFCPPFFMALHRLIESVANLLFLHSRRAVVGAWFRAHRPCHRLR